MRLGSRTVRDLALAFSLVSERSAGNCKAFDYDGYWSNSLARAVVSQTLARIHGIGRPEEAYISGLLMDVGRLALASVYPERYAGMLSELAGQPTEAILGRESGEFDINHSQVAVCMLTDWGLPEAFSESVAFATINRGPLNPEPGLNGLGDILRYATIVADALAMDESTSALHWERLGTRLATLPESLGMEEAGFKRFFDTCVKEWVAWGDSLEVPTQGGRQYEEVLRLVSSGRERVAAGEVAVEAPAPTPVRESQSDNDCDITILAVDDDPTSLKILVTQLEKGGFRVIQARGGKEALKLAITDIPDVVIADLLMPDMDGHDLCRSLRRTDIGRNMYFLLLTGCDDEQAVVDAFDAGVDDFVTKPFMPRVLAARVKGAIRLATLQQQIETDKRTMMRQVAELGVLTRRLRATSLTDALTELPNRRYAMKRLDTEWASVRRTGRSLSLVMMDIDHFKSVNDNHGHDVGDEVLKAVAATVKSAIRASDEVCRIGGEEFLVICKNTAEEECMIVSERIRTAIEQHIVNVPGFERNVTASLGVAGVTSDMPTFNTLIKAADDAVYAAKHGGRNRSMRASDLPGWENKAA